MPDDATVNPVPDPQRPAGPGPGASTPQPMAAAEPWSPVATPPPALSATASAPPARVISPVNEAIPTAAPVASDLPIGTIPEASQRRRWAKAQLSNWRLFVVRFFCSGVAVIITVVLVPGLSFSGWQWGQFTAIAIIFGLLNALVKPVLQFLVLRFIFSTYGVVVVLINALLLWVLSEVLDDRLYATGVLPMVVGGLVVGVAGLMLETISGANPPVLDRDYKERNGLR